MKVYFIYYYFKLTHTVAFFLLCVPTMKDLFANANSDGESDGVLVLSGVDFREEGMKNKYMADLRYSTHLKASPASLSLSRLQHEKRLQQ